MNNNDNNNIDHDTSYQLFKSVFDNIVIFRTIFKHVRLYKRNEKVIFQSLKDLQDYKEREYIESLIFKCNDDLKEGDLPINNTLKEVSLHTLVSTREKKSIKSNSIPHGVEILNLGGNIVIGSEIEPYSKLPSTIHTLNFITRITVSLPTDRIGMNEEIYDKYYKLPPNITSISFCNCPNISMSTTYRQKNGFMVIPNTIKTLKFSRLWNNEIFQLRKGDIPEGVTCLSLGSYQIVSLKKEVLPNTIRELEITCNSVDKNIENLFNFMPPNVETLKIDGYYCLRPRTNLISCNSVKKLSLSAYVIFKAGSLPLSVTDLTITDIPSVGKISPIPDSVKYLTLLIKCPNLKTDTLLEPGIIPNTVVSLTLNKIITQEGVFPSSLEEFKLVTTNNNLLNSKEFEQVLPVLPISLTSITLPSYIKKLNITFPKTINKINYN